MDKSCIEWLREKYSKADDYLCDDLRAEAKALGYTRREFKEARKALGIKTWHQFDEYGATENWFWYIQKG